MTHPDEQTLGRIRKDGGWDKRFRSYEIADDEPAGTAHNLEVEDNDRLRWSPTTQSRPNPTVTCKHCRLVQREHINGRFCPEWRLRQLDGDR